MKNIFVLISLSFMLFFQGCTTKEIVPKVHIAYPPYPQKPRIVYLDTYRGGKSVETTSSFDLLLGEDSSPKTQSQIAKPYGVAINSNKLYVADSGNNAVFVIDMGTKDTLDMLGTDNIGGLRAPATIAFDDSGMVYVSSPMERVIKGYDQNGTYTYVHGGRLEFTHPTGIAIDKKLNRLYVVDTKAHHFKAFDINTKELLYTVGKRGKKDAEFNFPTNITVDKRNGNILVADTQNFRIQIFDKDGNFIRTFGKVGDRAGMFARPKGVAVDTEGHIYVTDTAFNNVQIFDQEGNVLMWFITAGYDEGQTRLIAGIWIDENDIIAIADAFSGRVQTFQYLSESWKKRNPQKYQEYLDYEPEVKIFIPSINDRKSKTKEKKK